jgi:hypothetical protein
MLIDNTLAKLALNNQFFKKHKILQNGKKNGYTKF